MEQLPGDLEGDEGLAGAGGERQQDARAPRGDGRHDPLAGDVLVIAARVRAALVLVGHVRKAVAPGVLLAEGPVPQLLGRGVAGDLPLHPGQHVRLVDPLPVAGEGEADGQFARVVLGLPHALGQGHGPRLGLVHRQLDVAIDQDIVGDQGLAPLAGPLDAAWGDDILPQDAAALDDAPARRRQLRVDVLGAGLGLVHRAPRKASWRRDFFRASRAASLRW